MNPPDHAQIDGYRPRRSDTLAHRLSDLQLAATDYASTCKLPYRLAVGEHDDVVIRRTDGLVKLGLKFDGKETVRTFGLLVSSSTLLYRLLMLFDSAFVKDCRIDVPDRRNRTQFGDEGVWNLWLEMRRARSWVNIDGRFQNPEIWFYGTLTALHFFQFVFNIALAFERPGSTDATGFLVKHEEELKRLEQCRLKPEHAGDEAIDLSQRSTDDAAHS
jgi:hypothetical protein